MSRLSSCVLASALLLGASAAQADDLERAWVWNLGGSAAEVTFEASRGPVVRVEAGEALEVPRPRRASGRALLSPGAELLLVEASPNFDASTLEVDALGEVRRETAGGRARVRASRPAWALELLFLAEGSARLGAGDTTEALAVGDGEGSVRFAVGLGRDSAVTVTVHDRHGALVHTLVASSTVPVRWRAELGTAAELDGGRLTLRVDRGHAVAGLPAGKEFEVRRKSITAAGQQGTAEFSQTINCSGDLTFHVSGGPANTCGELNTYRNGSWQFTPNWLCTDSSGDAMKGPWSWSNTPNDQTDEPAFIRWPNGNTTNNVFHIWDKTSADTYRDSPWGAPPTSYYGHATDTQWGTGFDFGGGCRSDFRNVTTNLWWDPATGTYSSSSYKWVTNTLSRVDRWYVDWSGPFPPPSAHSSGHTYWWTTCCTDACDGGLCISSPFTP